jgi:hypothetical protein
MRNKLRSKIYWIGVSLIFLILIISMFLIYKKSKNEDNYLMKSKNEESHINYFPCSYPLSISINAIYPAEKEPLELPIEINEQTPMYYLPSKPENAQDWKYLERYTYPENDIDSNVMNLIYFYYYRLEEKDFDFIYKYGAQGRTLDEITKLYSDITFIKGGFVTQIDEDTYNVKVGIVSGTEIAFYSTDLDIGWNYGEEFGGAYIKDSQSIKYSGEVILECLDNERFPDACFIRDLVTGDHLVLDNFGIRLYPVVQLAKREGSIQYLTTNKGEGGIRWDDIYEYNLNTHQIVYIQTLIYGGEYFYNIPNLRLEDCNYRKYEEYLDSGCVYNVESYRDTLEFIADKEQALEWKNYSEELAKYVDDRD